MNVSHQVASVPAQSGALEHGRKSPTGGRLQNEDAPLVSQAYPASHSAVLVQPELVQYPLVPFAA
jgi:hypothetical protein